MLPVTWSSFCAAALALWSALLCGTVHAVEASDSLVASNETLLWGPYRPNVYFGLRPRIPQSIFTGLMWASVEDFQATQSCTLSCFSERQVLTR